MGIFSKIQNYIGRLKEVENSISLNKEKLLEVHERNVFLEKEIDIRTKELDQANKTLVSLQNIWEMMNSSEPLTNVLEGVAEIIKNQLGYIHSAILAYEETNEEKYFYTKAFSKTDFANTLKELILSNDDYETDEKKLAFSNDLITQALQDNEIKYTQEIGKMIKLHYNFLNNDVILKFINKFEIQSLIIVPIYVQQKPFGVMLIYSPRKNPTNNELNFLKLFSNQIEFAVIIADLFATVKKQSITDPLTGLYNRRYFEECITKEAERAIRLNQPFSIISLDLDYLKKINDTYGHQVGDNAIITIAKVMKKNARSIDIPTRLGGEEFSILLSGIDSHGAVIAAERLRMALEMEKVPQIGKITASIGVATFIEQTDRVDTLIEMADQAMYQAKLDGRNKVVYAKQYQEKSWQEIALDTFIDILSKQKIPINKEISDELIEKLDIRNLDRNTSLKSVLYSVVDSITKTYNKNYAKGLTEEKMKMANLIAQTLELPKKEINQLKLAILLYDIGTSKLPKEILRKKEPLTTDEKKIIKEHPTIASQDILKFNSDLQDILPIITSHHENIDGTGYPKNLKGEDIPISSQIILLIDVYYALISKRPHRRAFSQTEAFDIIRKDIGKKWNEKLVETFISLIEDETEEED